MLVIARDKAAELGVEVLCQRTLQFLIERVPSFARAERSLQDAFVTVALDDVDRLDLRSERALPSIALGKWVLGLARIEDDPSLVALLKRPAVDEPIRLSAFDDEVERRLGGPVGTAG